MATKAQLDLREISSRILMMWFAFGAAVIGTAFLFGVLGYFLLMRKDEWTSKVILGVVNSFMLRLEVIIYKSLFPETHTAGRSPGLKKAKIT